MISPAQQAEIERILNDELEWTIGSHSEFTYKTHIVEVDTQTDIQMIVEIAYKHYQLNLLINIDEWGNSTINDLNNLTWDLTPEMIWETIAMLALEKLPAKDRGAKKVKKASNETT